MTALTSTLQSVSLSLNISRACQRTAKDLEAQVWTARVEAAYKLEQAKSAFNSLLKNLTLTLALFLPLAMIWTGIIVAMHVRVH